MQNLMIENLTREEFFTQLENRIETVVKRMSPDRHISMKMAANISNVDYNTIWRWLQRGSLQNHAEGNEHPKISLHELLTKMDKKNGQD